MICFPNCFAVIKEGMRDGLAMLWSSKVTVEIKSYSVHHIDVAVYSKRESYWKCTSIYGHPKSAQK